MQKSLSTVFVLVSIVLMFQCGKDQSVEPQGPSDLCAVAVVGPTIAAFNQQDAWQILLENEGSGTATEYSVVFYKEDGEELDSIYVTSPIAPGGERLVELAWTPTVLEETEVYGQVVCPDDIWTRNDVTPSLPIRIYPQEQRQYFIWDNDNDSYHYKPDASGTMNCEDGLKLALRELGIRSIGDMPKPAGGGDIDKIDSQGIMTTDARCDISKELPRVLRNYKAVFIELGLYCRT